jgi:hypothetical protein
MSREVVQGQVLQAGLVQEPHAVRRPGPELSARARKVRPAAAAPVPLVEAVEDGLLRLAHLAVAQAAHEGVKDVRELHEVAQVPLQDDFIVQQVVQDLVGGHARELADHVRVLEDQGHVGLRRAAVLHLHLSVLEQGIDPDGPVAGPEGDGLVEGVVLVLDEPAKSPVEREAKPHALEQEIGRRVVDESVLQCAASRFNPYQSNNITPFREFPKGFRKGRDVRV